MVLASRFALRPWSGVCFRDVCCVPDGHLWLFGTGVKVFSQGSKEGRAGEGAGLMGARFFFVLYFPRVETRHGVEGCISPSAAIAGRYGASFLALRAGEI